MSEVRGTLCFPCDIFRLPCKREIRANIEGPRIVAAKPNFIWQRIDLEEMMLDALSSSRCFCDGKKDVRKRM